MNSRRLRLSSHPAALTNGIHFLVELVLFVSTKLATCVVISAASPSTLDLELILVAKLQQILLSLFKSEGGWDLVINV